MKVLHVLQNSLPSLAGYSIRSDALLRALQDQGLQVVAVTGAAEPPRDVSEEEISGIRYYRTNATIASQRRGVREWKLHRALALRLAEVAAIENPDILHVHSPAYNGLAGLRVSQRRAIPCIYEIRALWEDAAVDRGKVTPLSLVYKASSVLESFVCRRADGVVTICDGLKREVLSRGISARKVFVAPNGVEPTRFVPLLKDRQFAKSIGADGCPVFGFIGSLFGYEGVEDLLDAVPAVIGRYPNARFLIVGSGERQAEVEARVSSLGLRQIIYRSRVPHNEVQRYYAVTDCLVYPRRRNRLTDMVTPLKPLEAMSMEKLVLASDVGGHRELVRHNKTGILYRAGDPNALIKELCRVASDPDTAVEIARVGRQHVIAERTWAHTAANHIAAYRSVTTRGQ